MSDNNSKCYTHTGQADSIGQLEEANRDLRAIRVILIDIKATLIALLICVPFCMLLSVWLISGMIK